MIKEELTTLLILQGTSHCSCLEHCFLFVCLWASLDPLPSFFSNSHHLPAACPFRTKLMYNNFLYALAARVAERVAGVTWETQVRAHLLDRIGMHDTTFFDEIDAGTTDIATPHMSVKGSLRPIDLEVHRLVNRLSVLHPVMKA